tara:strand:- start:145 stop:465 length:321 start_codon:yes stop_codon:yes gene_type:complete
MKKIYLLLITFTFTLNSFSQIEDNRIENFKSKNIDLFQKMNINDSESEMLCKLILRKERRLQYVMGKINSKELSIMIESNFDLKLRGLLNGLEIKKFRRLESKFKH